MKHYKLVYKKMDFTVFNLIWLLVLLSVSKTLYYFDPSVLCQVCDKKVKKKTPKHIRHHRFPRKYVYITTGFNRIARLRIKEYIYKLRKYTENGPSIYGRSQNCHCFAIPFTLDSRENSWRPVIRLGTTRLDNTTPIVRSESQENREPHIEDLLRIRNITGQAHRSDYSIVGSLYIDNNGETENPENGACGGTPTEHFVSLPESNLSTMPGFPSFLSSELPLPNSSNISTELNNSTFEEPTPAIAGENSRMNRHLITNQQTERTAEPTMMAFKLHPNQDNEDSSHCRFCGGKLRNVGTYDDTTERQGGARPETDKNKTSAHALVNSDPMISIREQRSYRKRAKSKEKTSDCDTDMQECTAELSNTQTGSAMHLPVFSNTQTGSAMRLPVFSNTQTGSDIQLPAGGDKLTNAAALTDITDVNISENKGPLRTFLENEKSSTRNTKSKSHPQTTKKERRFNEKGIKDEARMANHACPKEMESENIEELQVVSTESPNSIQDVAIEGNSNAPSEDNTLAITEFDNIDQRMTVDRGSISDSSDVIQPLKDK